MKQNIYIKAMEIGFSKIGGISYLDLKRQIEIEMGSSMGRKQRQPLLNGSRKLLNLLWVFQEGYPILY